MIKFIVIALLGIIVLFLYSACVISSRCSRLEEEMWDREYEQSKNR